MKRETLKEILLGHYTDSASNHILRGIRKPSYEVMLKLHEESQIPFGIWVDIKSYLKDSTKQETKESSAKKQRRVS